MTDHIYKAFTTYSKQLGRDPQICRDLPTGHWVNPKMKRCNNCGIRLTQVDGKWTEQPE
jgi:hypothetical protein